MTRTAFLALLVACGSRGEKPAAGSAAAPPPKPARVYAPDAPLPEGATTRLGGTRFRTTGRFESFARSPDGTLIALGDGDNAVTVWNAETGAQVFSAGEKSPFARVSGVAFAGDRFVYSSGSDPLTVVSTKTWEEERKLDPCPKAWIEAMTASPDGTRIAVACEDVSEVRIVPLDGGEPFAIESGSKRTEQLAWSADGAWIAVLSMHEKVPLLDVAKRTMKLLPGITTDEPNAIAFGPRGAVLAYDDTQSYTQEKVRIYDVNADKELGAYEVHLAADSIAWSADGLRIAYGQNSGTYSLAVVDLVTHTRREMMRPKQTLHALAFAGPHLWVAVDRAVRLWDIVDDVEVAGPAGHRSEVLSLAYRPDGKALASGGGDDTVRIWDLASRTSRELSLVTDEYGLIVIDKISDWMKWPMYSVSDVAWSRDGARLYTASGVIGQGVMRRWNAGTGTLDFAYPLQNLHTYRLAVAPDESVAYSVGTTHDDGEDVRTIRLSDGKVTHRVEGAGEQWLAMSPDGKLLAYVLRDGLVIADAATGDVRASPSTPPTAMAFSPDSTRLAAGNGETLQVYTFDGAEPVESWITDSSIESLAFTPDGRVVAGTYRGDVIVTKPGTDEIVRHEGAHRGQVHAVAIAPDGKSFASGGADGQILIWPL